MKNQKSLLVGIAALIINLGCGITLWMLWSPTGPEFLQNLMINPDWGITAAFAQDIPQRITRIDVGDVKPGGKLTIDSEIGTINVQTADTDEVKVIVTKEVEGKLDRIAQKALDDFEVTLEQNNSDIRIQGEFKRDRQYWMKEGHPLRLHFQATVPYQFNVVLKTTSTGAIHVDNLEGTVRAETSIGNLHLGEIQGTVWGKTGGPGSITLKGSRSDVDLESGVGNIELVSVAGKVIAKTGGPGKVVLKECQSDVDVESGVGNIELGSITGKVIAKTGGPGKVVLKECQSDINVESGVGNIELGLVTGKIIAKTGGPGKIVLRECQSDINVESGVGNIELISVAGKVIAKTGGPGKVVLKECQSDINVESGVGNIELGSITGEVIAKTGGPGKVVLRECQSGVEAASGIGNIHAEIPTQLMHPWTLRTSGPGKIEVVLDSETAVNIDAETNGSISSDIPIQVQGLLTEDRLKGALNGGGPLLKLRTSLGEIRLKKRRMGDRHEKGRR